MHDRNSRLFDPNKDSIKTMKLYTHVDRFEDEMKARGLVDRKISESMDITLECFCSATKVFFCLPVTFMRKVHPRTKNTKEKIALN